MTDFTSGDGSVTVTVEFDQDADGAYAVRVSNVQPAGTAIVVEVEGTRVYEDPGQLGTGSEG